MTFDKFKQYPQQISTAFMRFPITIGFLTFLTLLIIGTTHTIEKIPYFFEEHHRALFWIYSFVAFSIGISVMLEFIQERSKRIRPVIQWTIYGFTILLTYLCNYVFSEGSLYLSAIGIAILAAILLVPSFKEKNDIFLWNFLGRTIKAILTAVIITGLFIGGLALIIFSCEILLKLKTEWIFFKYVLNICWSFVAPVIALAGMPNLKELEGEKPLNKFISGSVHFLFVPVLIIYLVILYIFAIRSIAPQYIESNMVTFFVSIATAASIIISLLLYPAGQSEKKSFDKYFLKVLPVATTPLLFLMVTKTVQNMFYPYVAIGDIYLVILNVWFIGAMVILFLKSIKKKIWWIIASLCLTNLAITCNPYNVKWIADYLSALNYVAYTNTEKALEIAHTYENNSPSYTNYLYHCEAPAQIPIPRNRSRFIQLSYHDVNDSLFKISNDTLVFSIALNDSLKENFSIALSQIIVPDSVDSDTLPLLELANPNATLLLTKMRISVSNDTSATSDMSVRGYLFLK